MTEHQTPPGSSTSTLEILDEYKPRPRSSFWNLLHCTDLLSQKPALRDWTAVNLNTSSNQQHLDTAVMRWWVSRSTIENRRRDPTREPSIPIMDERGKTMTYNFASTFTLSFGDAYPDYPDLLISPACNNPIKEVPDMVIRLYLLNSVDGVGVFGRRTNGECKNKVGEELTHIREGEDEGNTSTPYHKVWNDFIDTRVADGGKTWVKDTVFGDELSFDISRLLKRYPDDNQDGAS